MADADRQDPTSPDRGHHGGSTIKPLAACKQCRARKVKCDKLGPRCSGCTRLKLNCSFDHQAATSAPPIDQENPDDAEFTQAGIKRKRTRQACQTCRAVKAKCSGQYPCTRCLSKGSPCKGLAGSTLSSEAEDISTISNLNSLQMPALHTSKSNGTSVIDASENASFSRLASTTSPQSAACSSLDKAAIRRYIDRYFESSNPCITSFLHKPTVLADWSSGSLSPILQKTLIALGWHASQSDKDQQETPRRWLREVQHRIVTSFSKQNITHLQVMLMLIQFRNHVGEHAEAWNLLPLAARLMFTMRLNYEHEHLDPVARESRRRLAWAVYQKDRIFCGGIEDLAVCPPRMMHIRLPCDDLSFQRGIASRAMFLHEDKPVDATVMEIHSILLRLLDIRHQILSYTKRVRREGTSPLDSYSELEALQGKLNRFESNLPAEFKLTSDRLMLMVHSNESEPYVVLHTHWMQCHCDLYRFFVPGIRESVSFDALTQTPANLIEHGQNACLRMALKLTDFWAEVFSLEPSAPNRDLFISVSIYQVAQIIKRLQNKLPRSGPHSIERLKQKLTDAIRLATPPEDVPDRSTRCLQDAQKVINTFSQDTTRSSSRASSVYDDGAKEHLTSRHGFLPRFTNEEDTDGDAVGIIASDSSLQIGDPENNAAHTMVNLAGVDMIVDPIGDVAMWDPFVNDYFDMELIDLAAPATL